MGLLVFIGHFIMKGTATPARTVQNPGLLSGEQEQMVALLGYPGCPLPPKGYLKMLPYLPLFQKLPPLSSGVLDPQGKLHLVSGQGC